MKIISISGLDGSGKSTQIQLLKEFLESQGKKVYYFHAVTFSIANKSSSSKSSKSVTRAGWMKIQLRKIALVIDLFRFKKLLRKLESEGYDFLLSDRYFYDSVINIAYLKKTNNLQLTTYNKIRTPDHAFYLNADPEIIMQRPRPADQGIEYLEKKKLLLDQAAQDWNLTIIDGNGNKEEIFKKIKSNITF